MINQVVFVLPSFNGGGAERVIISLANMLDRERFQPTLMVLDGSGPLRGLVDRDLSIVDLKRPRLRDAIIPLIAAISRTEPAVVVSTMGYVNLAILIKRRRLPSQTKLIMREANEVDATLKAIPVPLLGRFLYKRYYRLADRIISPSKRIEHDLCDRWGIPANKVCTLPNPLDVDRLRRLSQIVERKPGKGKRFVAAGRLVDQKGFDRLIKWLSEISTDFHLKIFGEGPMSCILREIAEKHGIHRRCCFAGFVNNPWPTYAGADAFLLPSRWEGMPNAALEALAVGTPVIATPEAGGIVEVSEMAAPGAVTIAESGAPFVAAMEKCMDVHPNKLRPSLLPKEFEIEQVYSRFEAILGEVIR